MKIGILAERLIKGFGVDLVVHNQANLLVELGHEVTIYVYNHDPNFFGNPKYSVKLIDSPLLFNPLKTELKLIRNKLKFFRQEKIDTWIIHTWPLYCLAPFLKGKKYIYDHGTVSTEGMYFKKKLVFWYQKYVTKYLYFTFSTKIITISKYLKSQLPFYNKLKTEIVYNGADHYTSTYSRNEQNNQNVKLKLGLQTDDITMLYIGRLNHDEQPYKGVDDLIEIFQKTSLKNNKLKLVMAGFGSEADVKRLHDFGIVVKANVSNDELLSLLDICDFYVSATKWEGFNLPMIEAQSFGKIPVIYNIGPHNELLQSGVDSFVVKSQEEFIEKVLFLAENPQFRKDHMRYAKSNAEKYTWLKSVESLNKIINN